MSDLDHHKHPAVAVDLAIMTVTDAALQVLLVRRDDADQWALPGGFVHIDASLDDTVLRVLHDKTQLADIHFEQLATYGAVDRDPRGRVISVTYLALCPADRLTGALSAGACLATVTTDWTGEAGGMARVTTDRDLTLAFDHNAIIGDVVKRLRGKLNYSRIAYALLSPRFTLRAVQDVHEAILARTLTKPAFRRKILDQGHIRPTGTFETGGAFRPAELYALTQEE